MGDFEFIKVPIGECESFWEVFRKLKLTPSWFEEIINHNKIQLYYYIENLKTRAILTDSTAQSIIKANWPNRPDLLTPTKIEEFKNGCQPYFEKMYSDKMEELTLIKNPYGDIKIHEHKKLGWIAVCFTNNSLHFLSIENTQNLSLKSRIKIFCEKKLQITKEIKSYNRLFFLKKDVKTYIEQLNVNINEANINEPDVTKTENKKTNNKHPGSTKDIKRINATKDACKKVIDTLDGKLTEKDFKQRVADLMEEKPHTQTVREFWQIIDSSHKYKGRVPEV